VGWVDQDPGKGRSSGKRKGEDQAGHRQLWGYPEAVGEDNRTSGNDNWGSGKVNRNRLDSLTNYPRAKTRTTAGFLNNETRGKKEC